MAVTVVVGGQYGSEGKGKVAHFLAGRDEVGAVVRVGGSNSGHTALGHRGETVTLRHLPTAALLPDVLCVLGPGSYIDVAVLQNEIELLSLAQDRLIIDRNAFVITESDRSEEARTGLSERIGSTGSGTGAAVRRRVLRQPTQTAASAPELAPYLGDTTTDLRSMLDRGVDILIEGTQGYGLSVLHSPHFPFATSRDTTAAGALAEAGLSPMDVREVVLVIRALPIRVAGNSGPLAREMDWEAVASEAGAEAVEWEYTSVTKKVRRVGRFDGALVRRAIAINAPTSIVLNHIDQIDAECRDQPGLTTRARAFVDSVEDELAASVDLVGTGPGTLVPVQAAVALA